MDNCPTCRGSGEISQESAYNLWYETCPDCKGTGKTNRKVCPNCEGDGLAEIVWTYDDGVTKSGHFPKCERCQGIGFLD